VEKREQKKRGNRYKHTDPRRKGRKEKKDTYVLTPVEIAYGVKVPVAVCVGPGITSTLVGVDAPYDTGAVLDVVLPALGVVVVLFFPASAPPTPPPTAAATTTTASRIIKIQKGFFFNPQILCSSSVGTVPGGGPMLCGGA